MNVDHGWSTIKKGMEAYDKKPAKPSQRHEVAKQMTTTTPSAITAFPTSQPLSLDDYDRIIGQIQDGALETEQLSLALDELRRLFQANYVSLILRVPNADSMGITLISGQPEWAGKLAYFP